MTDRSPQLKLPKYFSVDKDQFIYVVDQNTTRIILINSSLMFIHDLTPADYSLSSPNRCCLDCDSRQLFVSQENKNELIIIQL